MTFIAIHTFRRSHYHECWWVSIQSVCQQIPWEKCDKHDSLTADRTDLDFNIHDTQLFGAHVDISEARIYGFVELAKTGNQTNGTWCEFVSP